VAGDLRAGWHPPGEDALLKEITDLYDGKVVSAHDFDVFRE
jgi:hypothetical protein